MASRSSSVSDSRYSVEVCGDCLGEWIPSGTILVADPDAELQPLNVCQIVIRDGDGPWARFMRSVGDDFGGACKIYLGRVEGVDGSAVMVGQLVPPVVCLIPESEIEAIHSIVGSVDGERAMTEGDKGALALVAPFVAGRA